MDYIHLETTANDDYYIPVENISFIRREENEHGVVFTHIYTKCGKHLYEVDPDGLVMRDYLKATGIEIPGINIPPQNDGEVE